MIPVLALIISIIVAFIVGGVFGVAIMALMNIAKSADEPAREREESDV